MALTITWQEAGQPPQVFNVNDQAIGSLDSYRQTLTSPMQNTQGGYTMVPAFPDVLTMIVGVLTQHLIRPAFLAFPPLEVQAAQQAAVQATQALVAAQSVAIQGALALAE